MEQSNERMFPDITEEAEWENVLTLLEQGNEWRFSDITRTG